MFKHLKLAFLSVSFLTFPTLMSTTEAKPKLEFPKTKGEFVETVFLIPFPREDFTLKSDIVEMVKERITEKIKAICSVIEEFKAKKDEPFSKDDFKKFGDAAFTQTFSDQDLEKIKSYFKDVSVTNKSEWISLLIKKSLAEVLFDLHKEMTKESAVFVTLFSSQILAELMQDQIAGKGFYGAQK